MKWNGEQILNLPYQQTYGRTGVFHPCSLEGYWRVTGMRGRRTDERRRVGTDEKRGWRRKRKFVLRVQNGGTGWSKDGMEERRAGNSEKNSKILFSALLDKQTEMRRIERFGYRVEPQSRFRKLN